MKCDPAISLFFHLNQNRKEKLLTKVQQLILKYEEKFPGQIIPTEPTYPLSDEEELCRILEECIRENITFEELTGFRHEKDCEY